MPLFRADYPRNPRKQAQIHRIQRLSLENTRHATCFALDEMISGIFSEPNYVAMKKMLDATALRHDAIASNIANIETPNYKRIDVAPDFQKELRQALTRGDSSQLNSLAPNLRVDDTAVAASLDGNTVQLEKELLAMNENTIAHSFETLLVSGTFQDLRMAITGKVT